NSSRLTNSFTDDPHTRLHCPSYFTNTKRKALAANVSTMAPNEMNVVAVGAGTMGSEIVYVSAASGHNVVVVEQDQKLLHSGMKRVGEYVQRAIRRGHITKDQAATIYTKQTTT